MKSSAPPVTEQEVKDFLAISGVPGGWAVEEKKHDIENLINECGPLCFENSTILMLKGGFSFFMNLSRDKDPTVAFVNKLLD